MEQAISPRNQNERFVRVRCSLEGLSLGDAFGERFFYQPGQFELLLIVLSVLVAASFLPFIF